MSTASTPINVSAPLELSWDTENATSEYYIYMHFSEVVKLKANQSRSLNITINGKQEYGPFTPKYSHTLTVFSKSNLEIAHKHDILISKIENSTLPPIINAFEIYSRNWEGDPCLPRAYSWAGLNCSYDSIKPSRVTTLNLSSSGLVGVISTNISNLVMLQYLDLSNNSLTGSVPDFLSQLQFLRVLNLEKNQLTGTVPTGLIEKSKNNSLLLSVDANLNVCGLGSCKNKNNVVLPIVASVVGLLILSLIVAAVLWGHRRKQKDENKESLESIQRQFTFADLIRITNNFERILGKGGFGNVYHGYINDTQVAVKVLSLSSAQGYQQFQAEASKYLTEKSDVYSFGIVLSKIITGRPVIERSHENTHISQWVRIMLDKGDIQNIVDPRLHGDFNANSAWKAIEIAMVCVFSTSTKRPPMSEVVVKLKECLSLTSELAEREDESNYSVEMVTSVLTIKM
ncbi:putative lrr receptor-like serine/threonine-protein kinase [Quercus suber]|uniref:Lrr receptor-like serine/threonine-protein kinase n=1 Tax=Quercus suber TaxID=58331 RepID=A0AAW0L0P1_QUESU